MKDFANVDCYFFKKNKTFLMFLGLTKKQINVIEMEVLKYLSNDFRHNKLCFISIPNTDLIPLFSNEILSIKNKY
jgi:hypothetical protein